jgi:hypothetical protein
MGKVQKPSNSVSHPPSSEPFRIYMNILPMKENDIESTYTLAFLRVKVWHSYIRTNRSGFVMSAAGSKRLWRNSHWREYLDVCTIEEMNLHKGSFTIFALLSVFCRLEPPAHTGSSLADFSTMKMEAIRSSETSVNARSTRGHIPEDGILHSHHRENPNLTRYCLVL